MLINEISQAYNICDITQNNQVEDICQFPSQRPCESQPQKFQVPSILLGLPSPSKSITSVLPSWKALDLSSYTFDSFTFSRSAWKIITPFSVLLPNSSFPANLMRQISQASWTRPEVFMMQWKVSFFLGTVKIIKQGRAVSSSSTSSLSFQVIRRILGWLRLLSYQGNDFFLLSFPLLWREIKIRPMQMMITTAMIPAISFLLVVCDDSECLVLTTLNDSWSLDEADDQREWEILLGEAERMRRERMVIMSNTVSLFWPILYYTIRRAVIRQQDGPQRLKEGS